MVTAPSSRAYSRRSRCRASKSAGLEPGPTGSWRTRPTHPAATAATCDDVESHTPSPSRLDQLRHRQSRGSHGGRPTAFDRERYKKRNTVERAINRLKGFRAVATRYEKRASMYLGTVTLAALMIWLRT
jgi:transposase